MKTYQQSENKLFFHSDHFINVKNISFGGLKKILTLAGNLVFEK